MSKPSTDSDNSSSSESDAYTCFDTDIGNNFFHARTNARETSTNSEHETSYAIRSTIGSHKANTKKNHRLTTETVVELMTPKGKTKLLSCFLDTGTTQSIILKDFVTLSQFEQQ